MPLIKNNYLALSIRVGFTNFQPVK